MKRPVGLTRAQWDALQWLATVEPATSATLKRHGKREATMDALVERGLVDREMRSLSPRCPYAVYTVAAQD